MAYGLTFRRQAIIWTNVGLSSIGPLEIWSSHYQDVYSLKFSLIYRWQHKEANQFNEVT